MGWVVGGMKVFLILKELFLLFLSLMLLKIEKLMGIGVELFGGNVISVFEDLKLLIILVVVLLEMLKIL